MKPFGSPCKIHTAHLRQLGYINTVCRHTADLLIGMDTGQILFSLADGAQGAAVITGAEAGESFLLKLFHQRKHCTVMAYPCLVDSGLILIAADVIQRLKHQHLFMVNPTDAADGKHPFHADTGIEYLECFLHSK